MIRKARISDIRTIHALLTHFSETGLLLPRSLSELYDHVRDYVVFEAGDGTVKGAAALHIVWDDLAEVRSLAVDEGCQRQGIGRDLVKQCLSEAVALGIYRVFTLTYQPGFFEKLGFKLNRYDYTQPPYGRGKKPVKMYIMSHPAALTEKEFSFVRDKLHKKVYGLEKALV